MTDNPNKKSLWDKIHLDPTMVLILLALLTYSALVIWSASGQDVGMMERKIGQIAMGVVIMIVMAQIPPRLWDKIHLDPTMVLILLALLTYSALVIWSASGQDMGMMERKIGQIAMGIVIMIVMAQIPPRVYEGWAPYLYIFCIILLVAVDAFGAISKGAQRWLDLGIVRFQPSEIAKIAVPLMVARFINRDVCPPSLKNTAIALVLIFLPTLLVAAQPDLGTSILVALSGLFVLFLSGLSWRLIGIAVVLVAAFIPILWFFLMHDYQRQRVMMLLDPETDPLGAGYHIIQSKIAIGSGGLRGKGWLHGTQSQLEFLPERHTDFIFAVLAEELGLIGVLILLALYILLIMRGLWIAAQAQTTFLKLPLAPAVCAAKAGCTAPSRSWSFCRNATPTLSSPSSPKSWA